MKAASQSGAGEGWIRTAGSAVERANLKQAFLDQRVASGFQGRRDAGRGEGRQAPDRALAALKLGPFERLEGRRVKSGIHA